MTQSYIEQRLSSGTLIPNCMVGR